MTETITDEDALGIQQELVATPDPARKAQLAGVLSVYRQQQEDAGRLQFEGIEEKQRLRDRNVRNMFSDPTTLGLPPVEQEALKERMKVSPNPEGERKVYANTVWLAHQLQAPYEKVAEAYPIARDNFADQVYGGAGKGSDEAFYAATRAHIAQQETVDEAARAGYSAALTGEDRVTTLAAAQQGKPDQWKDEHTKAFAAGYEQAQSVIGPHRALVADLTAALERSMKGGAKKEDEDAIAQAKEKLVDMPVQTRRIALQALALAAKKAGKDAEKGTTLGTDWFAPVVKPVTGWFQEAGEAGGRFLSGGFSGTAKAQDLIEAVPDQGEAIVDGKLETPDDARRYVEEQAKARRVYSERGSQFVPRGTKTTLTPAQSELIRVAKSRAKRELTLDRQLARLAEETDPVGNVTASAFGTSVAALGIVGLTGPGVLPIMAGMYSNIEYDKLRMNYPELSHGQAQAIAGISGGLQAAADLIGFRVLRTLPGLKSFLSQDITRVLVTRAAIRFGVEQATQTGVEVLQDYTTGLVQDAYAALSRDVPSHDWSKEVPFWEDVGWNFIGMLPLTLLGIGISSVQEARGLQALLSNNRELGRSGVVAADRVKIVDLAAQGKADEAQEALVTAWEGRSPVVARQFGNEAEARRIELETALDAAARLGLLPRIQRTEAGYTITAPDGTAVTVKDRVEAVNLATQYADDLERKRQEAILEGFEAISRGEDILDYDPAREGTLKAGQADPAGGWTEEQATQAAIVQGTLMGMSEEEARATTWAVLGHNQVERAETVRDGVATLVNVSKTKLNAGANVLTAVEEAVHGNWTRGVTEGAWTPQEGLQWVRLGERLLGEELLPMSDAEALTQLRALSEAISALVVADAVGRRKDGSRVLSGAVTRGLTAEMQRAKQQDRGAVGKLRQFLLSWRTLFGQVFRRARQLAKARKEGKVGADFDAFLDQMLSTDPQARHERGVAREVEAMAEDAGMPFSLAPEGGWQYPRPSKYSVPRTDAEAAGNALLEPGERLTDAQLLAVKRATSYYLPEYYNKAGYLKMVAAGGGLKSGLDPAKLWEESEAFHPAARAAADAFAEAHKPTYQTEAQRLALKGNYKYPSSFSKPILRVRSLKPGDRIGEYGGKIGPSGQSERIVAKVEMNTRSAGKDVPAIVYLDDGSELHLTSQSPIVRYGNTSDIQREKTPATKGTTTQTGEGAIQGEGQVEFQFSLAPRDLLDRVSARLQSHLRKPEAREAFYKLAKERLARIRADSTTWRGDTVEGLDSMAERDRSAASLEREAKVRLRMRQRELIDEGMAGLSRATLAAFHSDAALADARENPIIAYMLKADPATPGGWSGQMLHPSKADERTINEYDDMPGGLPRWFWGRSGGMAPDQMAQELADAGLIADPYPATMWKAIDSAFKTAWETKDAIKSARDAVRKVERDAYAKAKAEADKWLEQAKANVPSGKEKMLAALRVADAILSAFPSEVRGRVGGFYKLASAGSDKGRLNVFLGMLDKLDLLVEKHLKALYSEQFNDVLERGRPGGKPGEGVSGKIGAAAHEWFAGVEKAAQMTREEADERMTEIEALLQEPDLTPEREAELVEEYLLVQEFGAFATRSAAEMETALNDAKEVLQRGRDSWLAVLGERKQLRANIVKQAVREVGNAGKLSDQSKGGKARSASPLAWAADKFVRQLWTWRQTLEATMNRDSAVANRFHDLARQATRTERDAVLRREAEFQDGLKNEVLPGRDRRARNRWLHDLLQPSREISIIEDAKTEKMEVPVSVARAVVDSGNTLAGHDFTDADAERLEAMLAENDARPERNRKEVLKFERVVFGGTRQKIQISEAEAIHLLMTWRQQEYRSGMELHGFDAEAMDEIRDAITPAGYRLMEWIGRQYREGYEPLNAVHARVRGVNLPRVENYAPGVFEHEGEVSEMSLDSPHLQNGNLRSGFTKRRKAHVARVRLDFEHHSVNALSLYWNHVAQVEHWKAWVEAVNEFKTVLRNRDLRGAVMAAHGQEAVNSMNGWLELFENGGLRNGWENQQQARWVNRLMRAKARVSLILRLPVYMVQSTASLTALLDLPAKQGLRSLGRVLAGQGKMSVREAFNHPVIQRRLHGGFSPEARIAKAAKSSSAGKFDKATQALLDKLGAHTTDIDAAMDWGMETIGRTDAAFTSVAAATAYDAHYAQAEALGLSGAAADSYATEKMEETVQRTAQPAEAMDRSLAEASPNVFLRLLMMFTSEPRQKIALELGVMRQVLKGQGKISEAARMVFLNHLVLGGMVWLVRSIARDLLNDDDDNGLDDPAWEAADLLTSVLLGPLSGLPILGDAAELVASTVAGRRQFSDSPSPAVGPIKDVITGTKALMKPPGDEEIEHYAKAIGRIARGLAMFIGGNAAAAGVAENVAEQVFQLGDNVVSE